MNITLENTDKLNAVLNMKVEQTDYEERVSEVLNDYRRKARVDGFRPGKVPMGIIKKMYYTPVLVDEVNKRFHCHWLPTGPMSLVLGAHTGPSMIGLAFAPENIFAGIPE